MTDTEQPQPAADTAEEAPPVPPTEDSQPGASNDAPDEPAAEPETFPREVVERLRQENGRYRQRAQRADTLAQRLHSELVRATGRLADPTDLPFDEAHLDDPEALAAAVDDVVDRKPHLATRRPTGDIGQGQRGPAAEPFSLLGLLKERT